MISDSFVDSGTLISDTLTGSGVESPFPDSDTSITNPFADSEVAGLFADLDASASGISVGLVLSHTPSTVLDSITTEQMIIPITRSIVPVARSGNA